MMKEKKLYVVSPSPNLVRAMIKSGSTIATYETVKAAKWEARIRSDSLRPIGYGLQLKVFEIAVTEVA